MKQWYKDVSDALIEKLKSNDVQQCLLEKQDRELAELLGNIPHKELQYFCPIADKWVRSDSFSHARPVLTHRLRPDWKRPEPEWWEGMSCCREHELINNRIGFAYLNSEQQKIIEAARKDGCVVSINPYCKGYFITSSEGDFNNGLVYRIHVNWRSILKERGRM